MINKKTIIFLIIAFKGNCVFGFDSDMQTEKINPFFERANRVLEGVINYNSFLKASSKYFYLS